MKENFKRFLWLFMSFGIVYVFIEVMYTAILGDRAGSLNVPYLALVGVSSFPMFIVGGLTGILLGLIGNIKTKWGEPNKLVLILGTGFMITAIEFVCGVILNVWLGLNIWDYSNHFGNLLGQISISMSGIWVLVSAVGHYLDDWLKWVYWDEKTPGTPWDYVKSIFK